MKVVFVGLSDKIGMETLSSLTSSGKIISKISEQLSAECHRVNLVQFTPLDGEGKLRYPTLSELNDGALKLKICLQDINADKVVLLGKMVGNSLKVDNGIQVPHPAYAIRQGKEKEYIEDVVFKVLGNKTQ